MQIAVDLPAPVSRALDDYAAKHSIASRQEAALDAIRNFLRETGHLDRRPEEGTRPENLTTANDD